ncbi:DUF305 domain-containing protein [Caldimonas tepidiphila]|uniref:DUF305 domain-containing protein n=1 Tax=Caldimonas tepidiphila TaxID=2315841 RepID=UPI000E5A8685|nr:DUF305 domain-containing protein [Caldimonas tepidiphila]
MHHPLSRPRLRHLLHAGAVALALVLPWDTAALGQTRPAPDTPPSRLGTDGEGTRSTPGATMHHRAGSGSTDLHAATMRGMQQMDALEPSGNVDQDFAAMMRAHHQGAIEMARIQLQQGKDPTLRRMAQQMIDHQTRELEVLERWLKEHPRPEAPGVQPAPR